MARGRGFEATPLILDGVLYVTGPNNYAWALDARTGRPFWRYRRELPPDLTYGASAPVNRGFGMLGDRLFMATLDAHLVALDAQDRHASLWDVDARRLQDRLRRDDGAARRQGQGDRRHLGRRVSDARISRRLRSADRHAVWRFYTVPAPGEPGSETWPASPKCWRAAAAPPGSPAATIPS